MAYHPSKGWTQEQDDLLREKIAAGYSAGQIARQWGFFLGNRTRSAIIGRIHRLGGKVGSLGRPLFWNEIRCKQLREMYFSPLGYTRKEMARELGCSIDQISNGITRLRQGKGWAAKASATQFKPGHTINSGRKRPEMVTGKKFLPVNVRQPSQGKTASAVTIIDLCDRHCRFPVDGEGAGTWYCGHERHGEYPYCAAHARISYQFR